ncbi:hypothetical protein [Vibrio gallaecicus]|uniref:hypothetical protein n=1 Tax=Vibrio gallaecicus TaxID=552386 RepID=UPI0025B41E30|nr:hypothetical protein [Vibrio gallaecicus]MDN3615358.1 hypothetical protein [Vibrio gallaecicus]
MHLLITAYYIQKVELFFTRSISQHCFHSDKPNTCTQRPDRPSSKNEIQKIITH